MLRIPESQLVPFHRFLNAHIHLGVLLAPLSGFPHLQFVYCHPLHVVMLRQRLSQSAVCLEQSSQRPFLHGQTKIIFSALHRRFEDCPFPRLIGLRLGPVNLVRQALMGKEAFSVKFLHDQHRPIPFRHSTHGNDRLVFQLVRPCIYQCFSQYRRGFFCGSALFHQTTNIVSMTGQVGVARPRHPGRLATVE